MIGSKKGLAREQLMLLLLVFALIIALMIFAKSIATAIQPAADSKLCKASVSAASYKYEYLSIDIIKSPFGINCKTERVTLTDDVKLKKGTRTLTEGEGENGRNEGILNEFVLQKMSQCWDQFGAGKIKVQDAKGLDFACIICSQIFPGKEFIGEYGGIDLDGIYDYAKTKKISESKSYMDYLTGEGDLPDDFGGGSIIFDRPYYTVFQVVGYGKVDVAKELLGVEKLLNKGNAVVHCSEGEKNGPLDGRHAESIGCDDRGNLDGVNFGKVIDGGVLTVRMVPGSGVTGQNCERLF